MEVLEVLRTYSYLSAWVTSIILAFSAVVAYCLLRTTRRSAEPQVECYLSPRKSNPVIIELVCANFGDRPAYNVRVDGEYDEGDFKSHGVKWRPPQVPFSILGPNEYLRFMFGSAVALVGDKGPPLKPFRVKLAYDWRPSWSAGKKSAKLRWCSLDIRAFRGMIPEWPEDEVAKAITAGLESTTVAIKGLQEPLAYIKKTAELVRTTALGDGWVSRAPTGRTRTEEGGSKGAVEHLTKRAGYDNEG